ncbi:NIL domain-containing protein [Microcoleus sp. FACHB-672]|uniref:NIL domain-containing protein n=1 Tax=Microcoleus sp. FACHB-672 TaxID=2692825 RepID=UPI001687F25E|nr:NIL domain-containing protein [Microcoleus sp. FACHB-672]MBD2041359.1 NIL domain-containing protein [Microcoleus sp. FACHB-672]
MVIKNPTDSHSERLNELQENPELAEASDPEDNPILLTRIRIRISKKYHQEPVISRLVSEYGLTVNIAAALLGANARDDGWFHLQLQGTSQQINSALIYLNDLDLEVWHESDNANDW